MDDETNFFERERDKLAREITTVGINENNVCGNRPLNALERVSKNFSRRATLSIGNSRKFWA
jgi:hypothetical protein